MTEIGYQSIPVYKKASGLETDKCLRGSCVGVEHLSQNLRVRADGSYVYVNNAKAACSTVKWLLWKQAYTRGEVGEAPVGNRVHLRDLPLWGSMNERALEQGFTFTFVRNPFARVLSSYLDKVTLRSDGLPRPPGVALRKKFGLSPGTPLSFRDFLRLINRSHPAEDDLHWRPQVDNVFFERVRFDYIGRVETFDQDMANIFTRVFGEREDSSEGWTPHATRAQQKIRKHYGPVEIQLVRQKYAKDFAAFGYAEDPCDETIQPFRSSLDIDPLLSAIVGAEDRRSRGEIGSAIDVMLSVVDAYPTEPDGAHFLGELYRTRNDFDEAAKWLDRAADIAVGRPGVFAKAVSVHRQLDNHDAAAKVAAIGLKEFPFNSRLRELAEQIGDNSVFEPADPGEMDTGSDAARPGVQVFGRTARSAFRSVIRKFRN